MAGYPRLSDEVRKAAHKRFMSRFPGIRDLHTLVDGKARDAKDREAILDRVVKKVIWRMRWPSNKPNKDDYRLMNLELGKRAGEEGKSVADLRHSLLKEGLEHAIVECKKLQEGGARIKGRWMKDRAGKKLAVVPKDMFNRGTDWWELWIWLRSKAISYAEEELLPGRGRDAIDRLRSDIPIESVPEKNSSPEPSLQVSLEDYRSILSPQEYTVMQRYLEIWDETGEKRGALTTIARELGLEPSNVRVHKARAKKKMEKSL